MITNKVAVLGGGSFGTVLANIAASNGSDVYLWVRDAEQALRINSEGANSVIILNYSYLKYPCI